MFDNYQPSVPSLKVTIHASHRKADVAVHVILIGQIGVRSIVYRL